MLGTGVEPAPAINGKAFKSYRIHNQLQITINN